MFSAVDLPQYLLTVVPCLTLSLQRLYIIYSVRSIIYCWIFIHYLSDWQGAYFAWKATAMGKNYVNGKTFLEKR